MRLLKLSQLQARKVCGTLLAGGSLLLILPLILTSPAFAQGGVASLRPVSILLVVPVVFLTCRYARVSTVIRALGSLLLATSVYYAWQDDSFEDLKWAKVAATGICGIGLLLDIRWAAYLWYLIAVAPIAGWLDFVEAVRLNAWERFGLLPITLFLGLLALLVCGGGSIAVASHFRIGRDALHRVGTSGARPEKKSVRLAGLAAACLVALFGQWLDQQTPDTEGFAQLHPTLKPLARQTRGHGLRACDKIAYCGTYVEISCHPEVDGLVSYFDNANGTLLMHCGGACMAGQGPMGTTHCSVCPPTEWSACVNSSSGTPR